MDSKGPQRRSFASRGRIVVAAAVVLAGCATTPAPVEQIKYFTQAFVAVDAVGQPLLDDLALAERAVGRRAAQRRAAAPPPAEGGASCSSRDAPWVVSPFDARLGFIDGFCLEDVGTFADLGDPRATAELRGGLRVIGRYAEVLSALAEGRNVDQALGEVDALQQEVSGLLALTGASVALAPALTALRPLLENAARQANAAEARRLILEGAPIVSDLIAALRNAVPAMFKVLVAGPRRALDVEATARTAVEQVEARRLLVSRYAVLLDRLQDAWDMTVAAARHPDGSRLADLVARTAQLRADAEAVRRSMAVLRSGGMPSP